MLKKIFFRLNSKGLIQNHNSFHTIFNLNTNKKVGNLLKISF